MWYSATSQGGYCSGPWFGTFRSREMMGRSMPRLRTMMRLARARGVGRGVGLGTSSGRSVRTGGGTAGSSTGGGMSRVDRPAAVGVRIERVA